MPTYTFEHLKTGETHTTLCTWKEAEELVNSGEYRMLPSAPMIVRGTGSVLGKIDSGFNDVLLKAKSAHKGSTIETK
jgi:hypothetical protein